ncbi:class I SAM-dependent methyltransferase [Actinophytocola oryzae]|uniref:Methyltransferase family protein n=1 Tax=Actinophytocola oryzae TaxID=502181 RepID=A0A4R7UTG0_9PSEU|nr:methyltransferase domain-containing protein [Actinophytocola oryzae]TDV35400.1 methyltransferase family protein [Actinophytocola oryzae]
MAHTHTHDNIDWPTRLAALRRADDLDAESNRHVADRLVRLLGATAAPVVVDIGSGGGGMSAAFAGALAAHGGGRVVLSDAVVELLDAATTHVRAVADGTPVVVESVQADASSDNLADQLPQADLVWASRVVHHLPDQQKAIDGLARMLAPGGWLALSEGGLATRCLPWDLGIGEPGLGNRLTAARDRWFVGMRAEMPGTRSLPVGWNKALEAAGLSGVCSFSYVVDHPAPASEEVRQSVVDWMAWVAKVGEDLLSESDRATVARLVDPHDDAYVGGRDDVFILGASTVYLGQNAR